MIEIKKVYSIEEYALKLPNPDINYKDSEDSNEDDFNFKLVDSLVNLEGFTTVAIANILKQKVGKDESLRVVSEKINDAKIKGEFPDMKSISRFKRYLELKSYLE